MKNAQISHGPKNSITTIMLFLHGALQLKCTAMAQSFLPVCVGSRRCLQFLVALYSNTSTTTGSDDLVLKIIIIRSLNTFK